MARSLWKVTRFCSSHLVFSPLSWPCALHCQLPSQLQMLPLHWRPVEGQTGRTTGGEKRKVVRGQKDQLRGVLSLTEASSGADKMSYGYRVVTHEKTDKTIKQNRVKAMCGGGKEGTHFLLGWLLVIVFCGLLFLSGTQEGLSLLCSQENIFNHFLSTIYTQSNQPNILS